MFNIIRHELKREGNKNVIVIHLDKGNTEFSKELDAKNKSLEANLNRSVGVYIKQRFPNIRQATVKVMVGSMLVATFAFTPALGLTGATKASAETAGATTTPPADETTTTTTPADETTTTPPADETTTTPPADDELIEVESPFNDLDNLSDEKFASIWTLYQFGVINGFEDGTFRPDVILTRGQAALMFYNIGWFPATGDGSTAFPDVKNARYLDAVTAMKEAGIFEGNTTGNFGIGDTLTREQMASVLVRAFGLEPIEGEAVDLVDLDTVSPKHRADVSTLYQHGITIGNLTGEYNPKGTVNRGDFSVFLYRAIINEISPSFDTSTAGVVDNGDQTATITISVNDRAGDPVVGLLAEDFTVGIGEDFYNVNDSTTLTGFTEVGDGVYEITYAPGAAVNEALDIYVFDLLVIDDLAVVIE